MAQGCEPTFAEIAEVLLEEVRRDALVTELAEPFMAKLPEASPGIEDTWRRIQRRMQVIAKAHALFAAMAPREAEHRALIAQYSG